LPRRFPDDPAAWQALATTYLFRKPPWLVLRHQHFRLPTGREIADYWISEYPPWVNVVAVTTDDQVVLIRQYRPGLGDVHYEIPAGVVNEGEDIETAARRELAEETGYGAVAGRGSPASRPTLPCKTTSPHPIWPREWYPRAAPTPRRTRICAFTSCRWPRSTISSTAAT